MADYDLSDVPTDTETNAKIELLGPIFLEAYRRSLAYQSFPNAHLLMTSKEEVEHIKSGPDFYEHGGAWEWRSPPGSAASEVIGYYRWSDTLDLFMPAAIPSDTDAICTDEFRSSWAASTNTDDANIDSTARSSTSADLTSITDAFEAVFEQCDTWSVKALLTRLGSAGEALTALIDRHRDAEFADIAELFEEWEGDDADHCYEVFGQRLRPAAGNHRQMLAALIRAACEEGIAQGTTMSELFNAVAAAHEKIQEAVSLPDYGQEALKRFFGVVIVGRVPYLGDVLGAVDFGFEISSEGEEKGKTGGWLSQLMDKIFPSYANVPTVELCNEVRDTLVETAEGELNDLLDARNSLGKDLDEAEDDWSSSITCDIIPGYVDE